MAYIIAYDLGTGGIKASLYDESLRALFGVFRPYPTYYPREKWHEQCPEDWWRSVAAVTGELLLAAKASPKDIAALALSGQSLVAAPLSGDGELLLEKVPIWSDTRASALSADFFADMPYENWYNATGNGFPAECYSLFKLLWLKKHMPEVYAKTAVTIGSKDYVNYRFTGVIATDPSYASGTGAYDLKSAVFSEDILRAAGISRGLFPEIMPSAGIIGRVHTRAAQETGLMEGTPVIAGGVDNACMALGARGEGEGRVYTSLGSSAWIALISKSPILDAKARPFVFAHVLPGYYASALSIFSAGSSFRWMRDTLCADIGENERAYDVMTGWAKESPLGANGLLFNPSLAGGTSQDKSINIRGALMGLSLGHTRADIVRAAMEGIALNLRVALDGLRKYARLEDKMLLCGGGSKSALWRQIFADAYGMPILKTSIDQDAASLGAAALAARGAGLSEDYSAIDRAHVVEAEETPNAAAVAKYGALLDVFMLASGALSEIGDRMQSIKQ